MCAQTRMVNRKEGEKTETQEELHQNTTKSMNKSHMLNVHSIQFLLY